jgi:hypothetical protein
MDPLKEIEAAEKRVNAARLFLLDHIDLPIRSGETYKTYKKWSSNSAGSIEECTLLIRERMKQ